MTGLLINALIALVVLGAVYFVAKYVITQMGLPAPAMVVLNVIFAIVALIWLLSILGGQGGRVWVVAG